MKNKILMSLMIVGLVVGCGGVKKKTPEATTPPPVAKPDTQKPDDTTSPIALEDQYTLDLKNVDDASDKVDYKYLTNSENAALSITTYADLPESLSVNAVFRVFKGKDGEGRVYPETAGTFVELKNFAEGADPKVGLSIRTNNNADFSVSLSSSAKDNNFQIENFPGKINILEPLSVEISKDAQILAKYRLKEGTRIGMVTPAFAVVDETKVSESGPSKEDLDVKGVVINKSQPGDIARLWSTSVAYEASVEKPNKKFCYLKATVVTADKKTHKVVIYGVSPKGKVSTKKAATDVAKVPDSIWPDASVWCAALIDDGSLKAEATPKLPVHYESWVSTKIPGGIKFISKKP